VAEHFRKATAADLPGVREIIDAAYRMLVENVAVHPRKGPAWAAGSARLHGKGDLVVRPEMGVTG
jgi:hypothetical protein